MISNEEPPLTPLAQEALDALAVAFPSERGITYEHAFAILNEEKDLDRPAAEDIVERLYMRGHIYEVEGRIRLTNRQSNK